MRKMNKLEEIRNYEERFAELHNHGVSPKLGYKFGDYRSFKMLVVVAYHSMVSDSEVCIFNTDIYAEACRYFNCRELTVCPTHHRVLCQA